MAVIALSQDESSHEKCRYCGFVVEVDGCLGQIPESPENKQAVTVITAQIVANDWSL
jgi:hypothetical protein